MFSGRPNGPSGKTGQRGMSLIELMVSMVILALVMVLVIRYFRDQQTTIAEQTAMSEVQQNVRVAMDMVLRDLRPTGQDAKITGRFGIAYGDTQTIIVTMDVDSSGTLDSNRVACPDSNEMRGFRFDPATGSVQTLVQADRTNPGNSARWRWGLAATNFDPAQGMMITYLDTTNQVMAPPYGNAGSLSWVKGVRVEMRGRSEKPVGPRRVYVTRSLRSDVLFRNKI